MSITQYDYNIQTGFYNKTLIGQYFLLMKRILQDMISIILIICTCCILRIHMTAHMYYKYVARIIGNSVVQFVFINNLNGDVYLTFLQNHLNVHGNPVETLHGQHVARI